MIILQTKKILWTLGFLIVFWNEFLYPQIYSLFWSYDLSICKNRNCSRFIFISDPQLQGYQDELPVIGIITRWDADRYISNFLHSAVGVLKPDGILVLGDVTDEGSKDTQIEHKKTMARVHSILKTNIPTVVMPGDNDIGGEGYEHFNEEAIKIFESVFGKLNGVKTIKGVDFVKVNTLSFGSVSRRGYKHEKLLEETNAFIEKYGINRAKQLQDFKEKRLNPNPVILISHIPYEDIYRNDQVKLLDAIQPTYIISGHTHEFKQVIHPYNNKYGKSVEESITPTISYRMGTEKIGFLAVTVSHWNSPNNIHQDQVKVQYCQMPSRYRALFSYVGFLLVVLIFFINSIFRKKYIG